MSLRNKIDEDYIQSIKSKDQQKIDTLRLIRSAIKDKDISSRTGEKKEGINDTEILSLLLNLIKQRKDSIEQFQKAKRDDLIKNEQNEIEVIKEYLPLQKSEEETTKIIVEIMSTGPMAISEAKKLTLIFDRWNGDDLQLRQYTLDKTSEMRGSKEGQEGLSSFLERRNPDWKDEI